MTNLRPYARTDRGAVERMNAAYYEDEHGFDASFVSTLSAALDSIDAAILAKTGAGWILEENDVIAGSLFLTPDSLGTGRIRLFFIRPDLHGRGLGSELLERCLQAAAPLGFEAIRVSTFSVHEAACALYRKSGFEQERRSDCHMFGRDLVQLDFARHSA